jgi:hypothetical protein
VLGTGVFLEFVEADGAARLHVGDALADALKYPGLLGYLAKLLIGGGVLNDQFGLAVDGEDALCPLFVPNSPGLGCGSSWSF